MSQVVKELKMREPIPAPVSLFSGFFAGNYRDMFHLQPAKLPFEAAPCQRGRGYEAVVDNPSHYRTRSQMLHSVTLNYMGEMVFIGFVARYCE